MIDITGTSEIVPSVPDFPISLEQASQTFKDSPPAHRARIVECALEMYCGAAVLRVAPYRFLFQALCVGVLGALACVFVIAAQAGLRDEV